MFRKNIFSPIIFLIVLAIFSFVVQFWYDIQRIYWEQYNTSQLQKKLTVSGKLELNNTEFRKYSENREDGVLLSLFTLLGKRQGGYYVEFGVENGRECNTRYLHEYQGWGGLLLDAQHEDASINLKREWITAENINTLFEKYQVPKQFDLLSIDVDYNDFYIWKALSDQYQPKVVIIEFNPTHLPTEDKVVLYDAFGVWDGSNYYGASILAMKLLGERKGYSLVYVEDNAVNLFFVRNDILAEQELHFKDINDPIALYKYPKYVREYGKVHPNGGHHRDELNRFYISAEGLLG